MKLFLVYHQNLETSPFLNSSSKNIVATKFLGMSVLEVREEPSSARDALTVVLLQQSHVVLWPQPFLKGRLSCDETRRRAARRYFPCKL